MATRRRMMRVFLIEGQGFFTLVAGKSTRISWKGPVDRILLFCQLLNLVAALNLVDKNFRGFEAGNEMLINDDRSIPGNIAGNFLLPLLINKTPEAANINVVAAGHGVFDNGKEGFYRRCYIGFVDSCLVCNLVDYVCFRHGSWVLWLRLGTTKLICCARLKNNIEKF